MILSPKIEGNRPRLACEIAAGGVVAARSAEPGGPLTAVARVELAEGAVAPSLKPGNVVDRVATIAAVRRAMEAIGARSNARNADLTLVIPDGAVRVLLLDFDALPGKITEALPIVRFRLKKLVPFDTDDAMVTYQVMSSTRSAVRVLAVAIPRDVLADYETVAREAGFEPGAVLPSTLAAVAGLPESDTGSLTVNVYTSAVTTAIARGGVLLLHRTVELTEHAVPTPASLPAALFETSTASELPGVFVPGGVAGEATGELLPLVDVEETAGEWAAQEPLPEFGRNPYADAISAETATEASYGVTGMPLRAAYAGAGGAGADGSEGARSSYPVDLQELNDSGLFAEGAPVERSPYASPELTEELQTEIHNSFLTGAPPAAAPTDSFGGRFAVEGRQSLEDLAAFGRAGGEDAAPVHTLSPDARAEEIARAVSVAVAYFEDLLSAPPEVLLSAGPLGADGLTRTLEEQGLLQEMGLRSRELVESAALTTEATTAAVPRSLLAGVVGALRS